MLKFKRINNGESHENDGTDVDHNNEFENLYKESLKERPQSNRIIEGTVARIDQDTVLVDIGFKSEGHVSVSEFKNADGEITVSIGDKIKVLMTRQDGKKGYILSKRKADYYEAWEKIAELGEEGGVVEGVITSKINGGFIVNIGVDAFLPLSQVDVKPPVNPDSYIGIKDNFKIIKLNQRRNNIVLSRRELLETKIKADREAALSKISEGEIITGKVKNITDYGAFIDIGGVDGLLHLTDITYGRIAKPSQLLKPAQEVTVKVLKFDKTTGKISLGMKQVMPDPWLTVSEKYPVGSRVTGKVVSLVEYGAFIELESGVEGLIHVSEMSWVKKVRKASDFLSAGDVVEAVVIDLDLDKKKISLGLKQVTENPWNRIAEKYLPGTKIEGEIRNITDFGLFVGIEDGIDGLVHVSDISWLKRVKNPSELYKKGDIIHAVVLKVDPDGEKLSLGIKQLEPDPWSLVPEKFAAGKIVKGKVSSVTDFGVFVELEEGIEGLIHVSELSTEKIKSAKEFAKIGDELESVVLSCDSKERRISLSIKALNKAVEKAEYADYVSSQGEATSNLGDLLKQELNNRSN